MAKILVKGRKHKIANSAKKKCPLFLNNRLDNFHKIVTILRDFTEEN